MDNPQQGFIVVDTLFALEMRSAHEVKVEQAAQIILDGLSDFTLKQSIEACDMVGNLLNDFLKKKIKKKNLKG